MKKFEIRINDEKITVAGQFPTGSDLKHLANIPQSYGIWLKSENRKDEDKEISDSEMVDLKQPGRNRFYTGHKRTIDG
jgi:hypothetical protein